jgi:type I restriction enzyme S subunit
MSIEKLSDGWTRVKFGDVVHNVTERMMPSPDESRLYVGLEHMQSESLRLTGVGSDVDLVGEKLRMRAGDVLFARRNPHLRRVAVAPHDGPFSAHGMVLRTSDVGLLLQEFLPYFLQSEQFMARANQVAVGSLSRTINWKDLKGEEFALPPLDEQQRIVELLSAVDAHVSCLAKQDEAALTARSAVLSESLFVGGDDWAETRLKDVAMVHSGYAFESARFSDSDGLPLIRIRDLRSRCETEVFYDGAFDEQYLVNAGDFLIGMDGEFRCYEWLGPKSLMNQRVCRIQSFNTAKVVPRYIYFIANIYLAIIEASTTGTTVKHISAKQIGDIQFPLPPLAEQHRIVEIVSSIEDLMRTTERTSNSARSLRLELLSAVLEGGRSDVH